jgi:hypothetical protein
MLAVFDLLPSQMMTLVVNRQAAVLVRTVGQLILKSYHPCLFLVELKLHARMSQLRRGGDKDDLLEERRRQRAHNA